MALCDYEWLAAIIAAHPNGRLVGRTRLQKEVLLLQALGMQTTYPYTIHYFGPYSEDLRSDVVLLEQFGLVREEPQVNAQGDPYYVLHANIGSGLPDVSRFQDAILKMDKADPVVLELAATYKAFRDLGAEHVEAMDRLRRKKGHKCDDGRDLQAVELLRDLGVLDERVAA